MGLCTPSHEDPVGATPLIPEMNALREWEDDASALCYLNVYLFGLKLVFLFC